MSHGLKGWQDEYLQQDETAGPPRPALPLGYRTYRNGASPCTPIGSPAC